VDPQPAKPHTDTVGATLSSSENIPHASPNQPADSHRVRLGGTENSLLHYCELAVGTSDHCRLGAHGARKRNGLRDKIEAAWPDSIHVSVGIGDRSAIRFDLLKLTVDRRASSVSRWAGGHRGSAG
jgi:hypothetical protein